MADIAKACRERAENYGALRQASITARVLDMAAGRIEAYEATLRQIADSGNSINARLAAQALETEHGNG